MLTWNDRSRGSNRQFMLFGTNRAVMKFSVVLFDDTIRGRRCQVCDRVVHRLHPDEEPIKFFQGQSPDIRSQLDQGLFVGRVRKATHVHLGTKVLKLVPSFHHGSKGRESDHD